MEDNKDYEKSLKEMIEQYKRIENEYSKFVNVFLDTLKRIDKESATKEEIEESSKGFGEVARNRISKISEIQDFLSESGILEVNDLALKKELQIIRTKEKS